MTGPRIVSVNVGLPRTTEWAGPRGHERDLEGTGGGTHRGGGRQPRGRRPGRPARARRSRQGGVRVRGRGLRVVERRARHRDPVRDVRREPHDGRHRPGRVRDRHALAAWDSRCSRSRSRASRASSSACAWATRTSSTASTTRGGPAPTCGSSTAGAVGAGDTITADASPAHGFTILDLTDAAQRDAPPELLARIAAIADIPDGWRDWARRQLERHGSR